MSNADAPDNDKATEAPNNDKAPENDKAAEVDAVELQRTNVRLTTVYGGRVCQFGRAYECTISDVSIGGAKVRMKNPHDFDKITANGEAQLIFERLSDYKALNAIVSWRKPAENVVGLEFTDPELRRRVVIKRLMPNRWRIANEDTSSEESP